MVVITIENNEQQDYFGKWLDFVNKIYKFIRNCTNFSHIYPV